MPKTAHFDPAEGVPPWERQPGETDKAWAAFVIYRNMGHERAIRKTQSQLGQPTRYRSVLEKWSSQWGWVTRAAAWDEHVDRREREAALEAAEKKALERLKVAQLMVDVSAKSLYLWNSSLNHAIETAKRQREAAIAAGEPAPKPPTSPISPGDTNRLADAGMKLVQLLEGKPTDIQERRAQISIEERRRGIQELVGNPKLREAMRQVALAMDEANGEGGTSDAARNPDPSGNGNAAVH